MRVDDAKSEFARDALRRMTSVSKSRVNALGRRIAGVLSFIRADPWDALAMGRLAQTRC